MAAREITNIDHARKLLDDFQLYNDNERYPITLFGLTPQEVFDEEIPDQHRFKYEIKLAASKRYQKNKSGKFCDVCVC